MSPDRERTYPGLNQDSAAQTTALRARVHLDLPVYDELELFVGLKLIILWIIAFITEDN